MSPAATTLRQRRFTAAVHWLGQRPSPALDLGTFRAVNTIVLSAHHPYPGQWRNTQGVIRLNGSVCDRLCPPEVGIRRTRAAVTWLNQRIGDTRYPSVATARELMFRIATAHPFVDGNGRTARALVSWLLLTDGYELCGDPEAYCGQHKASCYEALACPQRLADPPSPPEAWNCFFGGLVDHCFRPPRSAPGNRTSDLGEPCSPVKPGERQ
jgi:hypothetical protein